ncbi:MAG: ABC transporter ATP-binding protein [Clostridia bacterium]|nr:ABC transporter ATP-binding protein [Clostridia bacterium]
MTEILRVDGLVKKYAKTEALKGISLTLNRGKIVGLLGPNGSGKTTLIKIINGLLTPTEGEVYVDGKKPGVETKSIVAYLPDAIYLNSWMTVKQIVNYFCDFYEDFRPELAYKMLENLNISPNHKLKTLSKGNKEKVCLILTMSRNALLYVLDEPIAGVDPAARDYVISTIINNYNPDATVLLSTHLISDIEQILDEAVFIQNGKIILHKTVEEIREENGKSVDELFREMFRWEGTGPFTP